MEILIKLLLPALKRLIQTKISFLFKCNKLKIRPCMAGPRQMVILNNDLFRHLQTESTWVAHTHLSNSTAYWFDHHRFPTFNEK